MVKVHGSCSAFYKLYDTVYISLRVIETGRREGESERGRERAGEGEKERNIVSLLWIDVESKS